MASVYVRQLSVGEVLRSVADLYKIAFWPTYLGYALPLLPGYALEAYAIKQTSWPLFWIAIVLLLAGSLFSYTAITLCISDACLGNQPNLLRSVARTRALTGPLILTSVLQLLIIGAGFVLLILPGFIFMTWFLFAPIIVVLEGRTCTEALKRSKALVKGFFFKTIGILLLLAAIELVWALCGGLIIGGIELGVKFVIGNAVPHGFLDAIGWLMENLTAFALAPLVFIGLVLIYYDLRARKEAYDNTALAAELAR
jgi:hypothetical protein